MKPLKNHVLIYDTECPMCALYTGVFTQYGWLEKNGRWNYSEVDKFEGCELIDSNRSRHEIALVDIDHKKVYYGLDSLFLIIGHKMPWLKPLFGNVIFQAILKQVYNIISYNRKVIAPSLQENENSCVPDFHVPYRLLYIICLLVGVSIAGYYIDTVYGMKSYLVLGMGIFWLGSMLVSGYLAGVKALFYLGQLVTILAIAAMLAVPIAACKQLVGHSIFIESIAYLLSLFIFIQQVSKRIKICWREYTKSRKQ